MKANLRKKLGTLLRKSGYNKQQTKSVVDAVATFLEACQEKPPTDDHSIVSLLMGLMLPIVSNTGLPVLELSQDILSCSKAFPESLYGISAYTLQALKLCQDTLDKLLEVHYPDQEALVSDTEEAIYRLRASYFLASMLICNLPNSVEILPRVEMNAFKITPEQSQQLENGSLDIEDVVSGLDPVKDTFVKTPSVEKQIDPTAKGFQLNLSKLNEIYERYKRPSSN